MEKKKAKMPKKPHFTIPITKISTVVGLCEELYKCKTSATMVTHPTNKGMSTVLKD